ncbi:uncharacterized protein METZ01_LOCUS323855, partial [marine metagenome]
VRVRRPAIRRFPNIPIFRGGNLDDSGLARNKKGAQRP